MGSQQSFTSYLPLHLVHLLSCGKMCLTKLLLVAVLLARVNYISALTCAQKSLEGSLSECTAKPGEMCARTEAVSINGAQEVILSCANSTTASCFDQYYCNDKDNCNADTSDTNIMLGVTKLQCKCNIDTMSNHVSSLSVSPKQSIIEDSVCTKDQECVVSSKHTVKCVISVPHDPNYETACVDYDKTDEAYLKKMSVCYCDTDKCNEIPNSSASVFLPLSFFVIAIGFSMVSLYQ